MHIEEETTTVHHIMGVSQRELSVIQMGLYLLANGAKIPGFGPDEASFPEYRKDADNLYVAISQSSDAARCKPEPPS